MQLVVDSKVAKVDSKRGVVWLSLPLPIKPELIPNVNDVLKVELHDPRKKSDKQRKMIFALINDIADFQGEHPSKTYADAKLDFATNAMEGLEKQIYSLANSSMSHASQFITFLVDTIIEYDMPTKEPLQNNVEDIKRYVYTSAMHKRCCACGKGHEDSSLKAEVHHIERVGMGRDRTTIDHIGMLFLPLCRDCHMKAHRIGDERFMAEYHLEPIEISRSIVDKYELNKKKGA